jgi:hypothetical protein
LIVHLARRELSPQRPPHGHTRDLRQRAREIRHVQILAASSPLDAREQRRRACQGRLEHLGQAPLHHGRIDLALAQDQGPQVCPALANILKMLAGGLPVGTADERRSVLQSAPGLTLVSHEQASPDDGQRAMAGRIGPPLGRKLGRQHPKAPAVHIHA